MKEKDCKKEILISGLDEIMKRQNINNRIILTQIYWDIEKQFEKMNGDIPDMKQSDINKFKDLQNDLKRFYPDFYAIIKNKIEIICNM